MKKVMGNSEKLKQKQSLNNLVLYYRELDLEKPQVLYIESLSVFVS